jgi:predicted outer membrane repeat protein
MKKSHFRHHAWITSVIALLFRAVSVNAATLTVGSSADSGGTCPGTNCTLRQAILVANAGDTIAFQIPATDSGYDAPTGVATITLTTGFSTTAIQIDKNLTIDGAGQKTVVQRSPIGPLVRVFSITAGTVDIANLTIAQGNPQGESGGGVANSGVLHLRNCTFTANTSGDSGGAVYNTGTLTVRNCTMTGNVGNITGSAIYNTGTLSLDNSTITLNNCQLNTSSPPLGAAVYNAAGGTVHVRNTIIVGNTAPSASKDVVGVFTSDGYNIIGTTTGSSWFANTGDQLGATAAQVNLGPLQDNGGTTRTMAPKTGSIALDQGNSGSVTTDQRGDPRPVHRTTATNVPGDFSDIGAVEIGLSQFPNSGANLTVTNTAEHNEHDCRVDECTLAEAVEVGSFITQFGGVGPATINFAPGLNGVISNTTVPGLNISAALTIVGPGARMLRVTGGSLNRIFNITAAGAAVNIYGLSLTDGKAAGSTFPDNVGGAILNTGLLTLTDCTLANNTGGVNGGCIYNNGANGNAGVTLVNCTLSGNTAPNAGGGIFSAGAGGHATLNLTNCSLDGNSAQYGGAIYNDGTGSGNAALTLTNCTLNKNTAAGLAGGIYNDALNPNSTGIATVTLRNTILRAGSSGANFYNDTAVNGGGTITSQGHNLSSDAAGGDGTTGPGGFLNAAADKRNTDPVLDTLRNNGGATDTLALLGGSPAINAGNDANAPSTDQRGYFRSGASDIGAFEYNGIVPPPTVLANISTRLQVQTGDNALIGGFIVTGTQPKKIIVRAIGPSLSSFFPGALADPILELRDSSGGLIRSNDNWRSDQEAEIIATTIPPSNDLESAIVATLPANNSAYTAIMRGVNGGTGVGLVEAYDLDRTVDSKLANISTRGLVQTGDNVMIGGFIVMGQAWQRVIVRAIGPSLPVPGKLADPTLELRDVNGVLLAADDNWRTGGQEAEIIATTIPPTNDLESAIVRNLVPGNYTAIVSGVNNTTGVALVEVYALN